MKNEKMLARAFPAVLMVSMVAQTVYAAGSCSGEAQSICSGNCEGVGPRNVTTKIDGQHLACQLHFQNGSSLAH
jgi:hypothetical protein